MTKQSVKILHGQRYLGNEAVHMLARPSKSELKLAIEIIEHTLDHLYDVPEKALVLEYKMDKRREMAMQ